MRKISILVALLLFSAFIGVVSATTWSPAVGCWTASDGTYSLVMWNNTTTTTSYYTLPANATSIQYLVISGGGAGGADTAAHDGGGGAGGLLQGNYTTIGGEYLTITVGAGGAAVTNAQGPNGVNSSLSVNGTKIAEPKYGGGGAKYGLSGSAGGSGGGASLGPTNGGAGVAGQGYAGGSHSSGTHWGAAGGGGAGGIGGQSTGTNGVIGGAGGIGLSSYITGESVCYAGGGSGESHANGYGENGGATCGGGIGGYGINASTSGTNGLGAGGGGAGIIGITSGAGGSGLVIIRYELPSGAPVANFIINENEGRSPIHASFTDTSTFSPTEWNWSFTNVTGNNTEVWFSTDQSPTHRFTEGNWSIRLNATNEYGTDTTVANTRFINVSAADILTPSFTINPEPSNPDIGATFTSTIVDQFGATVTPSSWIWHFGDGSPDVMGGGTTVHAYTITGVFTVNLSVTNRSGFSSSVEHQHTVINATIGGIQDIYMRRIFKQTFTFVNSKTGASILSVSSTDAGGTANTTSTGTLVANEDFGYTYITFKSSGYSDYAMNLVVDSDNEYVVQMVELTTPSAVYIPMQVRFRLVDLDGYPVSGVTLSATPINFTAPSNWTELLFGISPSVNIRNTTVYGNTGSDGSWVAPMFQSFQYNVTMIRSSDVNYNITLYPSQPEYTFMIPIGYVPIPTSAANIVTYSLANASINNTYQYINMSYSDTSTQGTTSLSFEVYNITGSLVASANYTGTSSNSQVFSQVIQVSQGQSYTYRLCANQSEYGWINQSSTFKLANQIALVGDAPSWVEEWIAIGLIILFAAGFSIWSKAMAMIIIPILTWYFQFYMGWLPSSFLSTIALGVMLSIGVLVYIRERENRIQ